MTDKVGIIHYMNAQDRTALNRLIQYLKPHIGLIVGSLLAMALVAGADIIMLDNMDCGTMCHCVELIGKKALVEASGGVNLDTVRAIAETGVDIISIGALTHSPRAMDISMLLD